MARGTVKWFDCKKGFGFVVNEEGKDVFVHYSNIQLEGFRSLKDGQIVEYEQFDSGKGLQGKNIKILELNPQTGEEVKKVEESYI